MRKFWGATDKGKRVVSLLHEARRVTGLGFAQIAEKPRILAWGLRPIQNFDAHLT